MKRRRRSERATRAPLAVSLSLGVALAAALAVGSCVLAIQTDYVAEDGTRVIHVEVERFKFTPQRIRVRQGERVRLVFTSRDTRHGVVIAEYGIYEDEIPPRGKGEVAVEVTADRPGTFTYRCAHLCGAGHAMMRGLLVVEPAEERQGSGPGHR